MARDLRFETAIAFARDLIRLPSLPGQEAQLAARVRTELEHLRFDDVWIDELGSVLGRVRGRGQAPSLLISCHLDAVDVGDAAAWAHDPFAADIEDGWLHGRGSMDIKGPLALITYAAAHGLESRPAGDVIVAHTVLEERGGWGMAHVMERIGSEIGAAIIGEATAGDVCTGHRGRAEVVVEVVGKAGHASAPDRAHNPIELLPRLVPALQRFADALPSDVALGRSTIAPTMIETLPRSRNVIPDRVRLTLDWRVLAGDTPVQLLDRLDTYLVAEIGPAAPFEVHTRIGVERQTTYTGEAADRPLFTPGFLMRSDHPIVDAAVAAVAARTGRRPATRPWTFATDGGYTCGVGGVPTLGFAPGEERFAHTDTERLELASARAVYDAYPDVFGAVQNAARALRDR